MPNAHTFLSYDRDTEWLAFIFILLHLPVGLKKIIFWFLPLWSSRNYVKCLMYIIPT